MKKFKEILLSIVAWLLEPVQAYAQQNLLAYAVSSAPSLANAQAYNVNNPGTAEVIRQTLYDFQLYPAAGATQFTFFALPTGQGSSTQQGFAGNAKNSGDTNMNTAAVLPSPIAFLVTSIELFFEPGSVATANTFTPQVVHSFATNGLLPASGAAVNDINNLRQVGFLQLIIGSKPYLTEAPLGRFPPKTRLEMDAALATNSASTATVDCISGKWGGRPYYLDPPIFLPPTQNFSITANFAAAVPTLSTNNGRFGCILDGFYYRNSQ